MKKIMKKQCKKISLWGIKGLLSVSLSSLAVGAFAQGADVCAGTAYTIASTVDASGASTYQWLENGQLIPNASAATYLVPNNKAAGLYTYVRQAKSADCSVWQSSNEFAVTVFNCSFSAGTETGATATFVDPRDGKSYKTVVMPDGRTWFAQNLNYTKDLTYNAYCYDANGKPNISNNNNANGVPAIGSYWCPAVSGSVVSGTETDCHTYGALYTWETVLMVDGKYADETKTSHTWDESWLGTNFFQGEVPDDAPNADKNNARGGTNIKGGGRGICPMGWYVPTLRDWAKMLDSVDGDGSNNTFASHPVPNDWDGIDAGVKLRSSGTYTGNDPGDGSWMKTSNTSADTYGFSVLPAGHTSEMNISGRGTSTRIWSSSYETTAAWMCWLVAQHTTIAMHTTPRYRAISVRCLKDE